MQRSPRRKCARTIFSHASFFIRVNKNPTNFAPHVADWTNEGFFFFSSEIDSLFAFLGATEGMFPKNQGNSRRYNCRLSSSRAKVCLITTFLRLLVGDFCNRSKLTKKLGENFTWKVLIGKRQAP